MFVASRSKNNLYTFSSLEVKHPLLYGWLRRTVYLSDNALTTLYVYRIDDVPRCGLSWCGHGGGSGGEKILNTAPAPGLQPLNCSQPQPRPPTLSAAVCCHQTRSNSSLPSFWLKIELQKYHHYTINTLQIVKG